MKTHDVIVIGGGLSGLFTAWLLQQNNIDCLVIEARDRLGGRIMTCESDGSYSKDGFDMGASWFWPHTQKNISAVIRQFGLNTFNQFAGGDVLFERMSREPVHRYRNLAEDNFSFRLCGGTASLLTAILSSLKPGTVQTGSPVRNITLTGKGARIETEAEGRKDVYTCNKVVSAVPPRLLASSMHFSPSQSADVIRRWYQTPTWMAPHAKFLATYNRAFWRRDNLCGTAQSMTGPMAEIHDATTSSGKAALFGFINVPAIQRKQLQDKALKSACVEQLTRLFGEKAGKPVTTLIQDWGRETYTSTAEDLSNTGHVPPSDCPWVSSDWKGTLFLAGSEVSPVEPGYLEGAIIAAQQAVKNVINATESE